MLGDAELFAAGTQECLRLTEGVSYLCGVGRGHMNRPLSPSLALQSVCFFLSLSLFSFSPSPLSPLFPFFSSFLLSPFHGKRQKQLPSRLEQQWRQL